MIHLHIVDCQLNAKLADLELGNTDETPSLTDDADIQTDDILVNWLAPEVVHSYFVCLFIVGID